MKGYDNLTPPSKPPSPPKKSSITDDKKKKKMKKSNEPQNIIDEMVPPIGPLQLIGGRYSFSLMDANGDGPRLFRGGNIESQQQQQQQGVEQVAISTIFYEHLFLFKRSLPSFFVCLQLGCVFFCQKDLSAKSACKM